MAVDINALLKQLETGIAGIAETSLKNYVAQANQDGKAFLNAMEDDLKQWSLELANETLNTADFKDLVLGQQDVLQMAALKQAGLTQIQLDQFKQAVLDLVINTVFSAIKKV